MEEIENMGEPINANKFCQYMHCCSRMSKTIPESDRQVQPLNDILETAYKQAGKRNKTVLKEQHVTPTVLRRGS